jgi:predicted O-methyltransferase YrrM
MTSSSRILAIIEHLEISPENLHAHWCVPREGGKLLRLLVKLSQSKNILEVGTSIGYSTLWLALGASNLQGTIDTIDASKERLIQAEANFKQAGLTDKIHTHCGDALTVLNGFVEENRTYDFIFIDARKSEYIQYLHLSESLLRPGGLLVADNTQSHRHSMIDFIEFIQASPNWNTVDLDTPNGVLIAQKE